MLASLLDAAEKAGSALPSLTHVSGLDAPQTIQRLHEKTKAQFWTGFGQSETSGFVTIQRVADRPGASGRPVPAAQVRVVDDYDREVPVGTPGEIVVRGPLVFQGYFGQPDVTAYTFRNGWHHTGDVGRFDADGLSALRQAQAGEGADQAGRGERVPGGGRGGDHADGRRHRRLRLRDPRRPVGRGGQGGGGGGRAGDATPPSR